VTIANRHQLLPAFAYPDEQVKKAGANRLFSY